MVFDTTNGKTPLDVDVTFSFQVKFVGVPGTGYRRPGDLWRRLDSFQ